MQALDDVRILDLTGGIAGPLGVLQLAEHGADVIKVEPPGGRSDRGAPASRAYNRSRRSLTLNLKDPRGVALFKELCATADVVVEAFAPGTMARLDLDYEALHADFPRLVYCSVPAWPSGTRYEDRPGYEALVHARTGQHWEIPGHRPGPVFLQNAVASFGAMYLVPIGIMSALTARERIGKGQHVEVSLLQSVMSMTTQNWNWTDQGQFLLPKGYPGVHQASVYECADGEWIHAATMSGVPPTRSEASILGVRELDAGTAYAMTPEERAPYEEERRAAFKTKNRDELVDELHSAGLGAEAIIPPHERFDHPQLRASGSVVEVMDPEVGSTTQVGMTIFLEGTPGEVRGPQPLAGAHTNEILRALGHDQDELARLRTEGVI